MCCFISFISVIHAHTSISPAAALFRRSVRWVSWSHEYTTQFCSPTLALSVFKHTLLTIKKKFTQIRNEGVAHCLCPNINVGPTVANNFCPPMEKRIWTNLSAFPRSCPEIRTLLYNLAFLLFHILLQAVLKADWMLLIHITYYSKRGNILQL